jgi:cytidylate kinase
MAILTISREYGSGGREIGRAVATKLGYAYEDRVTLLAALRAADPSWERFGDEYDEHKPSLWERHDWSYRGYSALLQRHLLEAAAADRVVIVGRGGAYLLAGVPTALHVRVVAPLAARIERIMRREHADHDSVRAAIERIDRERAGFIRAVYHRSWDDPAGYDMICDTSLLEQGAIVEDIVAHLAARDHADRAAAQRILALRLAAARVRAALFTDRHLQLPTLEVQERGEEILVQGVLHRPEEKLRIRETACANAGNHPVRLELKFR